MKNEMSIRTQISMVLEKFLRVENVSEFSFARILKQINGSQCSVICIGEDENYSRPELLYLLWSC